MTNTLTREMRKRGLTAEELSKRTSAWILTELENKERNLSDWPEQYLEYARVCENDAGLRCGRGERKDWLKTFSAWADSGYTVEHVRQAIASIHREKKIMICRPGSITHRLAGEAALRRVDLSEDRKRYTEGEYADFIEH